MGSPGQPPSLPASGSPVAAEAPPPPMINLLCLIWVADKRLQHQLHDMAHGAEGLLCMREEIRAINSTHLAAVLESRLRSKHKLPICIGLVEHWDPDFQRWVPMQEETSVASFPHPVKLRVWGRKRRMRCVVLPLRQTAASFAPRAVTAFADTVQDLALELRSNLPPSEADFGDILYLDPEANTWVLLEDIGALPETPQLKLVPSDRSLLLREGGPVLTPRREERPVQTPGHSAPISRLDTLRQLVSGPPELRQRGSGTPVRPPPAGTPEWAEPDPQHSPRERVDLWADGWQQPHPHTSHGRLHTAPVHEPAPRLGGPLHQEGTVYDPRTSPPRHGGPTPRREEMNRSDIVYAQEPSPMQVLGAEPQGMALARLRHQVEVGAMRCGTEALTPAGANPPGPPPPPRADFPGNALADGVMPPRLPVSPLPHVEAEVRRLHMPQFRELQERGVLPDGRPRPPPDPHRDLCCYPGSGQHTNLDSSGHGDLKRSVIAYTRSVLQEAAVGSPIADYLPAGGLTTQQLVNVTALAAHHFMVRCPLRPGDPELTADDRASLHTILAYILADLPGQYRAGTVHVPSAEADEVQTEAPPPAAAPAWPPPPRPQEQGRPVVVLMRPMLAEDTSVVLYGTVTCPSSVTCRWELRRDRVEVPLESIFNRGLAVTESVSASSFCLRILAGTLHPGGRYEITLHVTGDANGLSSSASQHFDMPPPVGR
eukprot:TRINITY_DN15752_c0_g1_i1.p1 TRINITY_DN15752_c0_g1~~TRINITY_DN15752_c0_g1_i1.p1  ORF type:complete len:731 (+),score=238.98 TRINITY_DN15752_c0_g1_i1:55-2193(+)